MEDMQKKIRLIRRTEIGLKCQADDVELHESNWVFQTKQVVLANDKLSRFFSLVDW